MFSSLKSSAASVMLRYSPACQDFSLLRTSSNKEGTGGGGGVQTLSKRLLSGHAKGGSLGSWQLFWCLFSFVIRKVRDTTGQKLNRGRQGNDRGGGEGRRLTHHSCFSNHKR